MRIIHKLSHKGHGYFHECGKAVYDYTDTLEITCCSEDWDKVTCKECLKGKK